MVQFKLSRLDAQRDPLGKANQYWKLENYSNLTAPELQRKLDGCGQGFPKSATKKRLFYLSTRLEQGLLSYEKCDIAELSHFCAQRGVNPNRANQRRSIIDSLEHADDHQQFKRFLDLPAELRNRTYLEHCLSFDKFSNNQLVPPPITTVSRQLRQETLVMFIQSSTLVFSFDLISKNRLLRVKPFPPTENFFARAPAEYIKNIRSFELGGYFRREWSWIRVRCCVEIAGGGTEVLVSQVVVDAALDGLPGCDAALDTSEKRVRAAFETRQRQNDRFELCEDDLDLFVGVFEEHSMDLE